MSFSIGSGGDDTRLRQMERLQTRLLQGSQRLASGKRIATAAEDAAGLAIAQRLSAAIRSDEQGQRNLADGLGLAQVAEGALQSSQEDLVRMRELSVQAGNGTLSSVDRQAIQQEYDQLAASLDQTAGSSSYGGRALLDGSASGAGAIVLDDGSGNPQAVPLPDARAATLGVAGLDASDPATATALDAASAALTSARTQLGAFGSGLSRQIGRLGAASEATEAARSRIEDVDVAQEVATQTRDRILMSMQLRGQTLANGTTHSRLDQLM